MIACDPAKTKADADALGVTLMDMDSVLHQSDFVCVNCFLSEQTRSLIGERELSLMKPSAYLINTARGPIVNEAALLKVLTEKRIAGAALDVFEQEPASADNPLLNSTMSSSRPIRFAGPTNVFAAMLKARFVRRWRSPRAKCQSMLSTRRC